MRVFTRSTLSYLAVAVLAVGTLAGCTNNPAPSVPNSNPSSTSVNPTPTAAPLGDVDPTVEGSPDALLNCLSSADIPASVRDLGAEGKQIVFEPEKWVINRDLAGNVIASYTEGSTELTAEEEAKHLEPARQRRCTVRLLQAGRLGQQPGHRTAWRTSTGGSGSVLQRRDRSGGRPCDRPIGPR